MWLDYFLISIWGGMVALDTTAALQVLVSHPLVSCSLVGLMLGNFPLGFLVGLILELIWLNEMPVGAASFSEGNIGATVAAAVAILTAQQSDRIGVYLPLALITAMVVSVIGGRMVVLMRQLNGRIYSRLIERQSPSPPQVANSHHLCILMMFLSGVLLTLVSVFLFQTISVYLCRTLASTFDAWMRPISFAFFGVGCGVMIHIFASRKHGWMIALGLLMGGVFFLF